MLGHSLDALCPHHNFKNLTKFKQFVLSRNILQIFIRTVAVGPVAPQGARFNLVIHCFIQISEVVQIGNSLPRGPFTTGNLASKYRRQYSASNPNNSHINNSLRDQNQIESASNIQTTVRFAVQWIDVVPLFENFYFYFSLQPLRLWNIQTLPLLLSHPSKVRWHSWPVVIAPIIM